MSAGAFFLYGMSNAGATRLFQHLFPTPLEKAHLRSLNEQIDIARERLISEEARALREIEVRRQLCGGPRASALRRDEYGPAARSAKRGRASRGSSVPKIPALRPCWQMCAATYDA